MRWLIVLAVASATCSAGCMYFDSPNEPRCENQACTDLFAMITVKVVNASNQPVRGLVSQSIYLDTGQPIMTFQSGIDDGWHVVADDNFLGQALKDREHHRIQFQATSMTMQSVTADYVIAAGECTCHVEKVSGPETLVLP